MIFIKSKGNSGKAKAIIPSSLAGLRHYENNFFHVWVTDDFEVSRSGETLELLWGEAYLNETKVILGLATSQNIQGAIGSYIFVNISGPELYIAQDGNQIPHLFYIHDRNNFLLSSCYFSVSLFLEDRCIDWEVIRDFVLHTDNGSCSSIFPAIKKMRWRESLAFSSKLEIIRSIFCELPSSAASIFETLQKNMEIFFTKKKCSVSYSGGLDSTLVLCALHSINVRPHLIHLIEDIDKPDDERATASRYAESLGYSLELIPGAYPKTLNIAGSTAHYNSLESVPFAEKPEFQIATESSQVLIDGNGGDSVFAQSPHILLGVDTFKEKGFISALSSLYDLATLKEESIYSLIYTNLKFAAKGESPVSVNHLPGWACLSKKPRSVHPWLQRASKLPAKHLHIKSIIHEVSATPGEFQKSQRLYSPLLDQNIISIALNTPIYNLFNRQSDRVLSRAALRENGFAEPSIYNQKRSSSQLMFNLINSRGEYFYERIAKGIVAKNLGFNISEMKQDLQHNMNISLNASLRPLLQIYRAELYLESLHV